jgi:ribosomal protein L14E/L6E/L27E
MIRDIQLNVDPASTKYPADDVPKKVLKWIEKNKRIQEPVRDDLKEGQVVVILEGEHVSKRAVFLKRLPQNLILCSGPSGVNGVPFVVMNQRYVLPVSVFLSVDVDLPVDESAARNMPQKDAENAFDLDASGFVDASLQSRVDKAIEGEMSRQKGMKTYFATPFAIPAGYCPMELNY